MRKFLQITRKKDRKPHTKMDKILEESLDKRGYSK